MALTPFRGFWDVQSEVDRLFSGDLISRQREGFTQERLRAPRLESLAREGDLVIHALGWSEEDLAEVRRVLRPVVSLGAPVGDDGLEWGESVADPGADNPAEVAARDDARRRLAEALAA